jgi:hypothetical protein
MGGRQAVAATPVAAAAIERAAKLNGFSRLFLRNYPKLAPEKNTTIKHTGGLQFLFF